MLARHKAKAKGVSFRHGLVGHDNLHLASLETDQLRIFSRHSPCPYATSEVDRESVRLRGPIRIYRLMFRILHKSLMVQECALVKDALTSQAFSFFFLLRFTSFSFGSGVVIMTLAFLER